MKRILVVEDNTSILENVIELLELSNYSVLKARDGKEGLDLAAEAKPDLVVCDIMMPVIDGYHFIEMLRDELNLVNVPVIFLTASAEKTAIEKGLQLGASEYITKPFEIDDLLNAIERHLEAD